MGPPLGTNIMGKNKFEYEKIYKIKITVFCEEISQKCLKTIYFKVEQNNTFKYGFNNKMGERPWLIPKINARSVPESK